MQSILILIVKIAAILGAGSVIGSWLGGICSVALERGGADPAIRRLVVNVARPLVMLIALLVAADFLGLDLTSVSVVLGATSLAIGMALKGTLSNVASGGILLSLRPYREGDFVQVGGQSGTVLEQGLYTTVIKSSDGVITTIPNDLILKAPVHNYSRNGTRRMDLVFTVTTDADLEAATAAVLHVFQEEGRILTEPAPQVLVGDTTPQGVQIIGRGWATSADFGATRSDLNRAAVDAIRAVQVPLSSWIPQVQGA